jgi:heat shock protein HslJ
MAWVMNLSIASSVMADRSRKFFTLHRAGAIALLGTVIWLNGGCVSSELNQSPDRLIGADWLALEIDGTPVDKNTESTVNFEGTTRITGNGGCNRFFATAKLSDETLEVGPLGTTRMACSDAIMKQEYRFLKALGLARRYRVDDTMGLLYLSNEQGQLILRFSQNKPGVAH